MKCTFNHRKNMDCRAHILRGDSITDGWSTVNTGFCQRDFCQTSEKQCQRHINEQPISELHGGGRFHSNQFKTTFYPPAIIECRLCLSDNRDFSLGLIWYKHITTTFYLPSTAAIKVYDEHRSSTVFGVVASPIGRQKDGSF